MFFGTFGEHHTCLYTYRALIIKHLDTILCYSEEIIKLYFDDVIISHPMFQQPVMPDIKQQE